MRRGPLQSTELHDPRTVFCIAKGVDKVRGGYTKEGKQATVRARDHLIAAVHTHRWAGNEAETGRRSRRQRRTPTEAAGHASRKGPGSRSSRTDPERTGQALRCGAATSSGDVRGQADRCREDEALGGQKSVLSLDGKARWGSKRAE